MKINSHNEWDTIKEIIIGSAKGTLATLTWGNEKNINQVGNEIFEEILSVAAGKKTKSEILGHFED